MTALLGRLKTFYFELEKDTRVSQHDPVVKTIQLGVETIVHRVLEGIHGQDSRFEFRLVKTGSFYDEAKVGEPDEFDYLAELLPLSRNQYVEIIPTSDPAFLQVKLKTMDLKQRWKDLLTDSNRVVAYNDTSMSHLQEEVEDEIITNEDLYKDSLIMHPSKVQRHFRKHFDKAMLTIKLPEGFEHGGFNRPEYSGVRRHGPATMIQLLYRTATDEFKINVDVTLGIALPLPIKPEDIKLSVLDRLPQDSPLRAHIQRCFENGPHLHVIPLYSRMLVHTGSFSNKISWRMSCSGIEKSVFDSWPTDAGPKKFIRILKSMRDKYFSDGWRKTHRRKFGKKRKKAQPKASGNTSGSQTKIKKQEPIKTENESKSGEDQKSATELKNNPKPGVIDKNAEYQPGQSNNDHTADTTKSEITEQIHGCDKTIEIDGESNKREVPVHITHNPENNSTQQTYVPTSSRDRFINTQIRNPDQRVKNIQSPDTQIEDKQVEQTGDGMESTDAVNSPSHEVTSNTDARIKEEKSNHADKKQESDKDRTKDHSQTIVDSNEVETIATQDTKVEGEIRTKETTQEYIDRHTQNEQNRFEKLLEKEHKLWIDNVKKTSTTDKLETTAAETTDLTDIENRNTSKEIFEEERKKYQLTDVSQMSALPGSGEYYGPKTYMGSIEIKTYLFYTLAQYWDESQWTDDRVVRYIESFFELYHNILEKKELIRHFFFDTFVCAPPGSDQRLEALKMYNSMVRDKYAILTGTKTYADLVKKKPVHKYGKRKRHYVSNTNNSESENDNTLDQTKIKPKRKKVGKFQRFYRKGKKTFASQTNPDETAEIESSDECDRKSNQRTRKRRIRRKPIMTRNESPEEDVYNKQEEQASSDDRTPQCTTQIDVSKATILVYERNMQPKIISVKNNAKSYIGKITTPYPDITLRSKRVRYDSDDFPWDDSFERCSDEEHSWDGGEYYESDIGDIYDPDTPDASDLDTCNERSTDEEYGWGGDEYFDFSHNDDTDYDCSTLENESIPSVDHDQNSHFQSENDDAESYGDDLDFEGTEYDGDDRSYNEVDSTQSNEYESNQNSEIENDDAEFREDQSSIECESDIIDPNDLHTPGVSDNDTGNGDIFGLESPISEHYSDSEGAIDYDAHVDSDGGNNYELGFDHASLNEDDSYDEF